jgi:D-tyrosyl-tRNA(Tyr) deacylase
MRLVVQRVSSASVFVEKQLVSEISHGLVIFVCFEVGDTDEHLERLAYKISHLRIFEDENEKMNLDIKQIKGEILSISQFTLSWNGDKGHRPSFDRSMPPQEAILKYKKWNQMLRQDQIVVKEGMFGKSMDVQLTNQGPVTFFLN